MRRNLGRREGIEKECRQERRNREGIKKELRRNPGRKEGIEKEVKIFLKLMGKYNPSEEEVREFFASHDEDDDGEVSVYEFLLTKY